MTEKKLLEEIYEIELDQSIEGKAKVILKDKHGFTIHVLEPKWESREKIFEQIYERWTKWKLKNQKI